MLFASGISLLMRFESDSTGFSIWRINRIRYGFGFRPQVCPSLVRIYDCLGDDESMPTRRIA